MEYAPVIAPTRSGKRCLTTTGSSTLATAIPASASAVSPRNPAVSGRSGRRASPTVIAAMPAATTPPEPKRRASPGAVAPTRAKHSAGTEVSRPATVALMPRPALASSSTGPRLVTAGRRLTAARTSATAASARTHPADRPPARATRSGGATTRSSFGIGQS